MRIFLVALIFSTLGIAAEPQIKAKFEFSISEHRYFGGAGNVAKDFSEDLQTELEVTTTRLVNETIPWFQNGFPIGVNSPKPVTETVGRKVFEGTVPEKKTVEILLPLKKLEALRYQKASITFSYSNIYGNNPEGFPIVLARKSMPLDDFLLLVEKNKVQLDDNVSLRASTLWPGVEARTKGDVRFEKVN